jgi:hypothetical protein
VPPDVLVLPFIEGALLIGPADRLVAMPSGVRTLSGERLRTVLAAEAEGQRLHDAAVLWGLQSFGHVRRSDRNLADQIASIVEYTRCSARFVPLFRDDPRSPAETGPLRLFQLGGGPPPVPQAAPRLSASAPPPPRAQIRTPVNPSLTDFENEDAEVAILRAAARNGTPFCEQCK